MNQQQNTNLIISQQTQNRASRLFVISLLSMAFCYTNLIPKSISISGFSFEQISHDKIYQVLLAVIFILFVDLLISACIEIQNWRHELDRDRYFIYIGALSTSEQDQKNEDEVNLFAPRAKNLEELLITKEHLGKIMIAWYVAFPLIFGIAAIIMIYFRKG